MCENINANETEVNEISTGYVELVSEEPLDENKNEEIEVPDILQDEFVNDENVKTVSMLNLKSKLNDVTMLADDLKKQNNKLLSNNEDDADFIDSRLEGITEEDIKTMSNDDIEKFFSSDDTVVTFNIPFDNHDHEMRFKRDFLIYRVQSNEAIRNLDNEVAKIQEEIAESQAEFDEIVNSYGNMNNWIRTTIEDKINNADTEDKKELYCKIRDNFECSFTLANLKEYLQSYKGRFIIPDFGIEKKSMDIYKRYCKVMTRMKVREDLSKFVDIERKFIGEEYAKRPNILMFSMMHLISSHYKDEELSAFGLFVTQFIINTKNLILNKFEDENEKETFINSIKEVIDIIG